MSLRTLPAGCVFWAALAAAPALAKPKPAEKPAPQLSPQEAALKRIEAAVALYSQGKYREAIAEYQNALALYPSATGPVREIGRCYRDMGEYAQAIHYFVEYLRIATTAEDRPKVEQAISQARAEYLAKSAPRTVRLTAAQEGAVVYALLPGGEALAVGFAPLAGAPLPAQATSLRVEHPSYPARLLLLPKKETLLRVDLSQDDAPAERHRAPFVWMGGAVLAAGASVPLGLASLRQVDELNAFVAENPGISAEEFRERRRPALYTALGSDALKVAAIACGAVGVITLVKGPSKSEKTSLRLAPNGLTLHASF